MSAAVDRIKIVTDSGEVLAADSDEAVARLEAGTARAITEAGTEAAIGEILDELAAYPDRDEVPAELVAELKGVETRRVREAVRARINATDVARDDVDSGTPPLVLTVDPASFTLGELEDIEDVSGYNLTNRQTMAEIVETQSVPLRLMRALVWIVERRNRPGMTFEDAREIELGTIEGATIVDPTGETGRA